MKRLGKNNGNFPSSIFTFRLFWSNILPEATNDFNKLLYYQTNFFSIGYLEVNYTENSFNTLYAGLFRRRLSRVVELITIFITMYD